MKLHCCLCGRPMDQAAVLIGNYPVGPKCAQKAGLMPLARKKGGLVFPVVKKPRPQRVTPGETLELFDEVAA